MVIWLSAPMAGMGAGELLSGAIGWGLILIGASLKLIVSYFRTPAIMFDSDNFNTDLGTFNERLQRYLQQIDQEHPWLAWLTNFSTYLMFGGLFFVILENF